VREAANAADSPNAGFVFPLLVDDPASVIDIIDAFHGQIIAEAVSAVDSATAGLAYATNIVEHITAVDTPGATVVAAPTATTWNPSDKSGQIALSNGNLKLVATASGAPFGVRGTTSKTTGKWYFETTWTGSLGSSLSSGPGIATSAATFGGGPGTPGDASVRFFDGQIIYNGSNTGINITAISGGDVVCTAIDLTNRRIWFRRNNGNWNGSSSNNPATNVGGIDISSVFTSNAAFPIGRSENTNITGTANFGASAFAQSVPSGFTAWT